MIYTFIYFYRGKKRIEEILAVNKRAAVLGFFKGCDLTVVVEKILGGKVGRKNQFYLSKWN